MRKYRSLFIGLASALLCALCVGCYIADVHKAAAKAQEEALEQYGSEMVEVCVAKRDLPAGETVDALSVESRLWIAGLLPDGAYTSSDDVIGSQVGQTIYAGEVVTAQRMEGAEHTLELPQGYSAVSLPVHDVQALGRALKAGMRADIYSTGSTSTVLLVEDALVLDTSYGDATSSSSSTSAWVTVAVLPELAESLVSAAQNLEIYFVLPDASVSDSAEEETGEWLDITYPVEGGDARYTETGETI